MRVISFGGGVNSSAMLVGLRERNVVPDAILFADTGGEKPATYQHIEEMKRWVLSVGFPAIEVIRYDSHHVTLEQECLNNETLPSKAFGFSGCSVKWKRQPMDKWLSTSPAAKEVWSRGEQVQRLIGIHAGETRRGKIPDDDKFRYVYPLREWKWDQTDCEQALRRAGIAVPCKSACFFCPAMRKSEVLELKEMHPDLMERAIEIERNAANNLETVRGLGRHWKWETLVKADADQMRLFPDNQAPLCDVCMDS